LEGYFAELVRSIYKLTLINFATSGIMTVIVYSIA